MDEVHSPARTRPPVRDLAEIGEVHFAHLKPAIGADRSNESDVAEAPGALGSRLEDGDSADRRVAVDDEACPGCPDTPIPSVAAGGGDAAPRAAAQGAITATGLALAAQQAFHLTDFLRLAHDDGLT